MNIVHEISVDFQRMGIRPKIYIKENDLASRFIHILFYNNGLPYAIDNQQEGSSIAVNAVMCYGKPDGTSGVYDTIGEGDDARTAYVFDQDAKGVTIEIAPSMCIGFGLVRCEVRFVKDGNILGTFTFDIEVERSVTTGTRADDYFSYRALDELYAAIDDAKDDAAAAVAELEGVTERLEILESIQHPTSWDDVHRIVDAGLASYYFEIGDQLQCQRNGETLTWDIIGINHEVDDEGDPIRSITLQLHDLLPGTFEFDAPEPSNPNTDIQAYGNNLWEVSNIRQWLNSSAGAGEWFSPVTEYDVAPSYSTLPGFLNGLDADFAQYLGYPQKLTSGHPTTDAVWLPSRTELFAITIASGGKAYDFYRAGRSPSAASTSADPIRIKRISGGDAGQWRTRDHSQARTVYLVTTSGASSNDYTRKKLYVAPCVCIV